MNKKIIVICLLSMFFVSSINAVGMSINNKNTENTSLSLMDETTLDAGSIKIVNSYDDSGDATPDVFCAYKDNFNIDIPNEGIIISFEVDIEVECPGLADWCRAEIKFGDNSDIDFIEYDRTENKNGILKISKKVMPGDLVSIILKAKLTDLWGAIDLGQSETQSFASSFKKYTCQQSTGGLTLDENGDLYHATSNPFKNRPWEINDCPPSGSICVFKFRYWIGADPIYPITYTVEFCNVEGESQSINFYTKTPTPGGDLRVATVLYSSFDSSKEFQLKQKIHHYSLNKDKYVTTTDKSYFRLSKYNRCEINFKSVSPEPSKEGEEVTFTCVPDSVAGRYPVYFKIDWGDGTISDWKKGNIPVEYESYHTYDEKGEYTIRYWSKDRMGVEGKDNGEYVHTVKKEKSKFFDFSNLFKDVLLSYSVMKRVISKM